MQIASAAASQIIRRKCPRHYPGFFFQGLGYPVPAGPGASAGCRAGLTNRDCPGRFVICRTGTWRFPYTLGIIEAES